MVKKDDYLDFTLSLYFSADSKPIEVIVTDWWSRLSDCTISPPQRLGGESICL